MKDFRDQRFNPDGVIDRVKELVNVDKDLYLRFGKFLPEEYRKKYLDSRHLLGMIRAMCGDNVYKSFGDSLDMLLKGRKSGHEFFEEFNMMFKGHEDLLIELINSFPASNAIMHHKGAATMHPIQSDKVTQYPVEISSYRNALGKKPHNAHLISDTSGSEDYSFNHKPKTQYEEILIRCEDDRYEVDMLLTWISSAIEHVEILLKKITNNTISIDTSICIEKHLSVWDLRCIERLYGDDGLLVMDLLKKNAHSALPVILRRLKQKQEEWRRCLTVFQKVWAKVDAKNHPKSLAHQTLCFKQRDSKKLNTKCVTVLDDGEGSLDLLRDYAKL